MGYLVGSKQRHRGGWAGRERPLTGTGFFSSRGEVLFSLVPLVL